MSESAVDDWYLEKVEQDRDEARAEVTALLNLVADIREAVGDPTGTLMQDELVERCRHLVITRDDARRDRDEARKIAERRGETIRRMQLCIEGLLSEGDELLNGKDQ